MMGIPFKLWAYAGLAAALSLVAWQVYSHIYDAGYDAAEQALIKEFEQGKAAAVAQAKVNWEASVSVATEAIREEAEVVERIRVVEKRIPVIVERVVPGDCPVAGPELLGLFNDAIRAASDQRGTASDPGEPG